MLSIILAAAGAGVLMEDEVDIPEPPYMDEHGNINWDKKFENDPNR